MIPGFTILGAWLLFGGSHIVLSSSGLREAWQGRIGPTGFTLIFLGVAFVTMLVLIAAAAAYGDQGMPGPNLGRSGVLLWLFRALAFAGATLMVAGLINFRNSAIAELARQMRAHNAAAKLSLKSPNQIERFTRHPFFSGLIILMSVHMLMASTLAMAIYFAGFAVTAALGIVAQDRKLRKRWQSLYIEYQTNTPAIPGMRSEVHPGTNGDRQWASWLLSLLLVSVFFVALHPIWVYANGAGFALFIFLFGTIAVLVAIMQSRSE